MPEFRLPRRSGAHRIAAIALYRALLAQCRAVPLAEGQRNEAQNIVRNRFKQTQHLHCTRRLQLAFEAGYEAIDHLDNAVAGDEGSKTYLASLLERAPKHVKEAPVSQKPSRQRQSPKAPPQEPKQEGEPRISLFDRPLPLEKLSGKRHIPVLFNANRVPVLRLKKPQPRSLSLYIHKRVLQRQKWHNQKDQLVIERQIAGYEDEWDMLTSARIPKAMRRPGLKREPGWKDTVAEALNDVHGKLQAEKEKNRMMGEKMQAVVDRETKLFEEER